MQQLDLISSLWNAGESELVIGLWTQKDSAAAPPPRVGQAPDSPRLTEKVGDHFSLLIERRCTPGPSGRFEPRYLQSPAPPMRSGSFVRFMDRIKGSSFDEGAVPEELLPIAAAFPLPKNTDLSTRFCLTVRKENCQEILGVGIFHLWELVYSAERKVTLRLGWRLLSEECVASLGPRLGGRACLSPNAPKHQGARRHSWAGLVHPGRIARCSSGERPSSPRRVPSPKRASRRRRYKSVSFAEDEPEDLVPYPNLQPSNNQHNTASSLRSRRDSIISEISGSLTSGSMPGIVALSLAPHAISQRDGGVVGIPSVTDSILQASIRRAFDVPYDSSWVLGKSPDSLLQAAYEFWGISHALIPQKVCAEGVLLFEDLYKQNETFVVPKRQGGGAGGLEWGYRHIDGALALSFSHSSGTGASGGKLRLDQALRHKSGHMRKARGELGEQESPDGKNSSSSAGQKEVTFVDNELLMYKIKLWDTKTAMPHFEDTWDALPGDRMYALRHGTPFKNLGGAVGGVAPGRSPELHPPRDATPF